MTWGRNAKNTNKYKHVNRNSPLNRGCDDVNAGVTGSLTARGGSDVMTTQTNRNGRKFEAFFKPVFQCSWNSFLIRNLGLHYLLSQNMYVNVVCMALTGLHYLNLASIFRSSLVRAFVWEELKGGGGVMKWRPPLLAFHVVKSVHWKRNQMNKLLVKFSLLNGGKRNTIER